MQTMNISLLFSDLYELTMGAAYFKNDLRNNSATFSLFIRGYSPNRNYYVATGIEKAITTIESLRFPEEDIKYLQSLNLFPPDFLGYLKTYRFTGDIWAISEGTIFFADEPVMEVTAPVIEAQVVETFLINALGLPILAATKASRCTHAAQNRQLIDFSLRRTQGVDSGINVARSSYIAGFSGTSNVIAGKLYDIPVSGTMAHSFVTAFEDEISAFRAYAKTFPDNSVFLIDTYDTLIGAENAVIVAKEMGSQGHRLNGVRLDSGDMIALSKNVRYILDQAGLDDVKIFASSGFDEYKIEKFISQGAQIDAFGVGTKLGVSADAPYLDIVYKMVEYNKKPVRKLSEGKKTLAGEKQIFRKFDVNGQIQEDIIGRRNEEFYNTTPLLKKVAQSGKRLGSIDNLEKIRSCFKDNFNRLPDSYKSLNQKRLYPVKISQELNMLQTVQK